jgi:molybdopterin biosynthesis enzyme MoaB
MQIPKFRDYITENKQTRKNKPFTVAILTINDSDNPNKDSTVELIEKACKKRKIKCVIVNTNTTIITGKDEEKNTSIIMTVKMVSMSLLVKIQFV